MFARMRLWVLLNRYSFSLRALRTIRLRRTLTRASDMSVVTMIIPSYIPDNSSKLFYFCVEVCEVGEENIKLVMVMDVKICFYLLSCSMARNQSCSPRWKEKMEIAGFLWMQVWVFSQDPGSRNSAIFRNMIPDSHKSLMVRQLHWTTGASDCDYWVLLTTIQPVILIHPIHSGNLRENVIIYFLLGSMTAGWFPCWAGETREITVGCLATASENSPTSCALPHLPSPPLPSHCRHNQTISKNHFRPKKSNRK